MTNPIAKPSVTSLESLVAGLPASDRDLFERIFFLHVTSGELVPPEAMHDWIAGYFGSVDAVRQQRIVKVTNKVTLDGALFNELRASRPIEVPPGAQDLEDTVLGSAGGPFCSAEEWTPSDLFGRIQGRSSITASNVAKYDGWHAVIVFDEHHPLHFTADQVADYIETARAWARAAHKADPQACYPFLLWNCLWRSGASILHGHAQMVLTKGMHYAKVEGWRRAALRYRKEYDAGYFADLVAVHKSLGLAVEQGAVTILPSLTPFKEKETTIIAPRLDADLTSAIYLVLHTFVERMGVQSFNLGLYQPPLCQVQESWEGFPFIVRIIDRGGLQAKTSDVGSMEFFAQSVVSTDPFRVLDELRKASAHLSQDGRQG